MQALLDDPYVASLVAEADAAADGRLGRSMTDVKHHVRLGDPPPIIVTLRTAREQLSPEARGETMLAHAGLAVTLDALHALLDDAVTAPAAATGDLVRRRR